MVGQPRGKRDRNDDTDDDTDEDQSKKRRSAQNAEASRLYRRRQKEIKKGDKRLIDQQAAELVQQRELLAQKDKEILVEKDRVLKLLAYICFMQRQLSESQAHEAELKCQLAEFTAMLSHSSISRQVSPKTSFLEEDKTMQRQSYSSCRVSLWSAGGAVTDELVGTALPPLFDL